MEAAGAVAPVLPRGAPKVPKPIKHYRVSNEYSLSPLAIDKVEKPVPVPEKSPPEDETVGAPRPKLNPVLEVCGCCPKPNV